MKAAAKPAPGQDSGAVTENEGRNTGPLRVAIALLGRYKRVVRLAALALIVMFVGLAVWKTWNSLPRNFIWHISWWLLVSAFVLLVAQELSYALIWRSILARLGSHLPILAAQRIYLSAEFVRYIPGNVWHVLTRIMWAERRGVPRVTGFASMAIELATKITSAALVFAVSLLFWHDRVGVAGHLGRYVSLTLGIVGVPLLLIGLHPRILTATVKFGLRKMGRAPVSFTLGYRDVLVITAAWTMSWVVAGVGFYLLVLALLTPAAQISAPAVIMAVGIYAIGWDIGFLSFITPSGLGFREAALIGLLELSGIVPATVEGAAVALAIALMARLLGTAAELVCITGAHAIPDSRSPQA